MASFSPFAVGNLTANLPIPTDLNTYARLAKTLDAGYYQTAGCNLFFEFDEEYNDTDQALSYSIYESDRNAVITDASVPQVVLFGDNRYELPLGGLNTGYYVLEVTNEKDETWKLRFRHDFNLNCNTQTGGGTGPGN